MSNADAPIGVFDSGIGGLSVVEAMQALLPGENIVYIADSRFAPYGDKSDAYVIDRSQRVGQWLSAHPVKAIVVACNTATAIAVNALRARYQLPIIGVEPGLKPAVAKTRSQVVAVVATAATLVSQRYADLLKRVQMSAPQVKFLSAAGAGWVECVERGEFNTAGSRQLIQRTVEPLIDQGADTLVLGCTHYPFLRTAIDECFPLMGVVDTGPAIASELKRRLSEAGLSAKSIAINQPVDRIRLFTTGDYSTNNGAHTLIERYTKQMEMIDL